MEENVSAIGNPTNHTLDYTLQRWYDIKFKFDVFPNLYDFWSGIL